MNDQQQTKKHKNTSAQCHHCSEPSSEHYKRTVDWLFWLSLIGVSVLFVISLLPAIPVPTWLGVMADTVAHMLHAMWWGIIIGALFIGVLSKVPREFIMAALGTGGSFNGLLRATAAGVLLDLCSHGILMVAAKLYERGASIGQVIAFLLASPWNSFSLTLILIGLIGWQWTVVFIVLSMLVAISTGWVFERLVANSMLPANQNQQALPEGFKFFSQAKVQLASSKFDLQFFKEVIVSGIRDSKMVVRWLLFGILLAAVLRVLFDQDQFQQYFGPTLLGLAITVLVATVLEVCSEGSTPIAADILTRAKAPGNGFAFLMSGVATDYTEVMVLKDTTSSWRIALCLPLITVPQVVLVAWLINKFALTHI
ncbi:permease [Thalassotalea ponticola]|uniref:permease n=1 Tax=Thalassotalea ponticola TaxID=1523392 RepID=UPI0025B3CFDD|nr:permease [Thalassotalea ponticola]MDN3653090.1 permease [Thalassotalea ponticola]